MNWSSRLLTDALLVIVTHQSALVWKILHSLVVLFTVTGIAEITIPQNKKEYVFIVPMLFAFMPVAVFNDTGWMATTLNYAWPLAACMPFFVILKKSLAGEEKTITRFFYIFSFILLFYGCNQEQMCAVVFASSVLMIICTVYENRGKVFSLAGVNRYYIFTLVLSALFFLLIILCPGNSIRFESEVNTWYPDYVNLNIFQKLDAGFLITMTYFFTFTEVWSKGGVFTPNYLILPLFIIMAVNFLSKKKHVFSICTVLLAGFSLFFGYLQGANLFKNNSIGDFSKYSNSAIIAETCVFIAVLFLTLLCVYKSFNNRKKSLAALIVMLAGFCTRMIISFSPTLYPSNTRPGYAMAIAIVVIAALVFVGFVSNGNFSFKKILYGVFAVLILLMFINSYRDKLVLHKNWDFVSGSTSSLVSPAEET